MRRQAVMTAQKCCDIKMILIRHARIAAMDRVIAQISQTIDWEYLIALENSLTARGLIDMKVRAELDRHAHNLARRYLIKKARLKGDPFSTAEEEILDVLATTVVTLRRTRQLPHAIVKCLRADGLIGAVQRTLCYRPGMLPRSDLEQDGVPRTALEAIVNRHPIDFDADIVAASSLSAGQPKEDPFQAVS